MRFAILTGSLMVLAFVLAPTATSVAEQGTKTKLSGSDRQENRESQGDAFSKKTSSQESSAAAKKEKAAQDRAIKNVEGTRPPIVGAPAGSTQTGGTGGVKKPRK